MRKNVQIIIKQINEIQCQSVGVWYDKKIHPLIHFPNYFLKINFNCIKAEIKFGSLVTIYKIQP